MAKKRDKPKYKITFKEGPAPFKWAWTLGGREHEDGICSTLDPQAQAMQDPILWAEAQRQAQNMYGLYSQVMQWPDPPQPTTLGPNQLAWCRNNLRGFAMRDTA